jgi:hypothetical protein
MRGNKLPRMNQDALQDMLFELQLYLSQKPKQLNKKKFKTHITPKQLWCSEGTISAKVKINKQKHLRNYHKEKEKTLTGMASPCRVITKSVLSSGSLATSNEHLGLANRSCRKQQFFKHIGHKDLQKNHR